MLTLALALLPSWLQGSLSLALSDCRVLQACG